jgi:hypothetical protein
LTEALAHDEPAAALAGILQAVGLVGRAAHPAPGKTGVFFSAALQYAIDIFVAFIIEWLA